MNEGLEKEDAALPLVEQAVSMHGTLSIGMAEITRRPRTRATGSSTPTTPLYRVRTRAASE